MRFIVFMKKLININVILWIYLGVCLYLGFIRQIILLLVIILLHELGHIFFVILFHGKVKQIELSLIGGIIDIETSKFSFLQEFLVNIGRHRLQFNHYFSKL